MDLVGRRLREADRNSLHCEWFLKARVNAGKRGLWVNRKGCGSCKAPWDWNWTVDGVHVSEASSCLLFASQKCWAQKQSYPRSTLLLDPLDNFIISHKNPETAQKLALLPLLSNDSDWWQQLNLCRVHAWQVQLTWRMETGGWTGVRVLPTHTHPPLRSPAKTISTRVYLGCTVEIRTPSPSSVSNGAAALVSL